MLNLKQLCSIVIALLTICCLGQFSHAEQCSRGGFVYGEDGIVDELLTCSLANTLGLDLTPHGDQLKSTSKTLIDQGLSNKTTVINARLSGLWTAKRPDFIKTGWRCNGDEISATSVIELSGLSLEVIERIDTPLHRSQHKLSVHRPCKTFDLPSWMCRQSKPIYRTISTWVNRAYFNLTLTQNLHETRPSIAGLTSMFTCPETFKQKITHSPSSAYLLNRHISQAAASAAVHHAADRHVGPIKKRDATSNHAKGHTKTSSTITEEVPTLGHPSSFTITQNGNMPAAPPYHNSVKVIMDHVISTLHSSITSCINSIDSDLSLMKDHESFCTDKFDLDASDSNSRAPNETGESNFGVSNECSNKHWIKSRIELANQVNSFHDEMLSRARSFPVSYSRTSKRDQVETSWHAEDPNQLLNPFGFYHDANSDRMIDDTSAQ